MMALMNTKPALGTFRSSLRRPGRTSARVALLFIGVALSLSALAQQPPRVGQGSLLVATEEIGDPSWAQTVVLVLQHGQNGTWGVAINRPTEVEPQELVPDLAELAELDLRVFRGGPVQPTQLLYLVRNPPTDVMRNAPRILENVYASGDLSALPRIVEAGGVDALRLFAGYVEWAPGQLDRELAEKRWTVTPGSADRIFAPDPALLWLRLRNAGDELLVDETTPRDAWDRESSNDGAARTFDYAATARRAD